MTIIHTEILPLSGGASDREVISRAAAALRAGALIVFPTETVYGLGCNSLNKESVKRLYDIMGRSRGKPLAIYVSSPSEVCRYVEKVPAAAEKVMERFWPGPLTILFQEGSGKGLIGFRCPDDHSALALIEACEVPLVAASANKSGCASPISGEEAVRAMNSLADIILKGGRSRYGRESTIIDLSGLGPSVVREGVIAKKEIEEAIGQRL